MRVIKAMLTRITEESQPGDEPPNSPVMVSEPTSTPDSQHMVIEDEEVEQQVGTSDVDNDFLQPGGSQDEPIVIDSSPPRQKVQRDPPKKLWSIFAPRPMQSNMPAVQRSSKPTPAAPFPSTEMQHVRGPQATYRSSSKFPCRSPRVKSKTVHDAQPGIRQFLHEEDDSAPTILEFDLRPCKSEVEKAVYLDTIPGEHRRSHPAINRLACGNIEGQVSPYQLWTEKWRPKHATEVLGNEKSASYLRDWLQALALEIGDLSSPDEKGKGKGKNAPKGVKRPRIVRAVDKRERKKRRIDSEDEDDSWIVYDDESEEEIPGEDGEEEVDVQLQSNDVNTFELLTNTIILTGPTGSGKTACVYACAEELDWDVFEVYPGIGKRNGASIDNLIGDVGKNHLVRKATTRQGNVNEISNGTLLQGFGFLESAKPNDADSSAGSTPRQSLVLLEEVDVLFKEDSNFWPAVINFLRDCRRPVICTCNGKSARFFSFTCMCAFILRQISDISLVPTSDLPVQNVLVFEPCPPAIAASYLQAVCCREGWQVDREILIRLYEMPYETTSDTPQDAPDLRRTMHRLQLWSCGSHEARDKSHGRQEPLWKSLPKQSEMLSFLDSEKLVCETPCEVKLCTIWINVYTEGCRLRNHVRMIKWAIQFYLKSLAMVTRRSYLMPCEVHVVRLMGTWHGSYAHGGNTRDGWRQRWEGWCQWECWGERRCTRSTRHMCDRWWRERMSRRRGWWRGALGGGGRGTAGGTSGRCVWGTRSGGSCGGKWQYNRMWTNITK